MKEFISKHPWAWTIVIILVTFFFLTAPLAWLFSRFMKRGSAGGDAASHGQSPNQIAGQQKGFALFALLVTLATLASILAVVIR